MLVAPHCPNGLTNINEDLTVTRKWTHWYRRPKIRVDFSKWNDYERGGINTRISLANLKPVINLHQVINTHLSLKILMLCQITGEYQKAPNFINMKVLSRSSLIKHSSYPGYNLALSFNPQALASPDVLRMIHLSSVERQKNHSSEGCNLYLLSISTFMNTQIF